MSFGNRLKTLRKEKGLTQKELGEKMEITEQAISHYEKNKRLPDTQMIQKLANYFDVSTDYLLGESSERSTVDKIKSILSSDPELADFWDKLANREDLQTLFKHTKNMDSEEIKQIIRVIKALKNKDEE